MSLDAATATVAPVTATVAPVTAAAPPADAAVTKTPVAPNDYAVANREPAATFPIIDCQKAANEPAAIPAVENPATIGAADITQTTAPAAAIPIPTFFKIVFD